MPDFKPPAQRGMICPFHKQDVSKVCHKCEFFEPLPTRALQNGNPIGEITLRWACVFKHATFLARDIGKAVDGVQGAINIANEQVWKESQKNLEAMIALSSRVESSNKVITAVIALAQRIEDSERTLQLIADALNLNTIPARFGPSLPTPKMIQGSAADDAGHDQQG